MANDAFSYLAKRQEFFDFLRDQFADLGEGGFSDWWHAQDETTFSLIDEALGDPAFGLNPHQLMPTGEWRIWFLRMGRGAGKTHAASKAANDLAEHVFPGGHGILVGATVKDVRDTMIEGDSGILATARPGFVPHYNKHDNLLLWPNGSKAIIRTADNPEDIRGPTLNWGWADELVKWRSEKSWDNLNRCVRNVHPNGTRLIVTTTPQRAKAWIKSIEDAPNAVVSTASTLANQHLDRSFLSATEQEAKVGSTKAREEVFGDWVEGDCELWTPELIQAKRVTGLKVSLLAFAATMDRRYLSVDPSGGKGKDSTGIMFFGVKAGKIYLLADWTHDGSVDAYTQSVIEKADTYLQPNDTILVEAQGGFGQGLITGLGIHRPNLKVEAVTNGGRDKFTRAETAFVTFQADKVRIAGVFPELEAQLCSWERDMKKSPDRGDAFTQGVNYIASNLGPARSMKVITVTADWF